MLQHASKAHEYPLGTYGSSGATPGIHNRSLLLCKVACGRVIEFSENKDTLNRDGSGAPSGFDSVYGCATQGSQLNWDEIVVYQEEAILPFAKLTYEYEVLDAALRP